MSKAATTKLAEDIFEPQLALDSIELSPTNPRKHITEAEIDEMAATIRAHGVIQPILVRPTPFKKDGFELVAGERRFRGSRRAEMATIPALIRVLDDIQVLEIQLAENVGRRDLHEMDEARSYQTMIESGQYDVKSLALKLGASKETVYKRLKLTGAIEELRQLFYEKEKTGVTANHVEQIARLPEISQRLVLEKGLFKKKALESAPTPQGRSLAEVLAGAPAELPAKSFRAGNITYDAQYVQVASTRELDTFIHQHVYSNLDRALFDLKDAVLLSEAGACTLCQKRFGQSCADRGCFNQKTNRAIDEKVESGEWIAATSDWNKKDAHYFIELQAVERNSCAHAQVVVCTDGSIRGQTKFACLFLKCEIHHPAPRQATLPALERSAPPAEPPRKSIRDEYRQVQQKASPDLPADFDKSAALELLGELRSFTDRALDHLEHDSLFLARGSAEAALSRAQRISFLLNEGVEDQFKSDRRPKRPAGAAKEEQKESQLDACLRRTLNETNPRWAKLRKAGATHAELKSAVADAFGIQGSASHPRWHSYRGLSRPRFYLSQNDNGKPTLEGHKLLAKVRGLLQIPFPKHQRAPVVTGRAGKTVSRTKREPLFSCPHCKIPNFTKRGLSAHVCKAKVSARTKSKGRQ